MHVRHAEGIFQHILWLIRDEVEHLLQAAFPDCLRQLIDMMAAASEQKDDARMGAQALRAGEHGLEFVRAPEISRIANDEASFESPLSSQRIVSMRNRAKFLIISPGRDHMYAFAAYPARFHSFRHQASDDHVGLRSP